MERAIAETHDALQHAQVAPLLTLEGANHEAFWASANDFPALRAAPREALARVNTLPAEAGQALAMAEALASEHGLRLLWLADFATGVLWLRLSADDDSEADDTDDGEAAGEALGRDVLFAASLRATLDTLIRRWRLVTTLACPSSLKRSLAIWGADPSGADLMREVKQRFDPDHRLNPGRFVLGI